MDIHFPSIPATFVHISRTGGTSFEQWVLANIDDHVQVIPPLTHTPVRPNMPYLQATHPNLGTVFTFVRNPYDRLVSIYHHVGQRAERNVIRLRGSLENKTELTDWRDQPLQNTKLVPALLDELALVNLYRRGFDYWVKCMYNTPDKFYHDTRPGSHHLVSWWTDTHTQVQWLAGVTPDIVVKTENLDTEFYKIQQLLACSEPLGHVHTSSHDTYQSYYTDETMNMVSEMFREDLDTFGYSFDAS